MNTAPIDERRARGILLSMGATYAMGTFNDNFFKQAALLLAAAAGLESIQGVATTLFALPFVLCSAWAGWLADRVSKSRMVIWSKFMELIAMLLGVWTLAAMSWTGIVAVVFIMGLQSTFFSPALNGAIPEIFEPARVPGVNALLKLATTATILLGIAAGGVVLDLPLEELLGSLAAEGGHGAGRMAVGGLAVLVSAVGVAAAFGIGKSVAPKGEAAPFPWFGPVNSVLHALECRREDAQLFLSLAGEAFFYGLSSFALLCINNLGVRELGFSLTGASLLSVALMAGICIGSLLAGRHEASSWKRFMLPACAGMALGLLASSLAPLLPGTPALIYLLLVFTLTGVCGGVYLIPLVSFIQVRPRAAEKGKILGISNFASFSGIILSGLLFTALGGLAPSLLLAASGFAALVFMAWAAARLARILPGGLAGVFLGTALRMLIGLRYRVKVSGLENISERGPVLFMPNHPALIDPLIIYSLLAERAPRPLADEGQMRGPIGRAAARIVRAVLIPDIKKDGAAARRGVEDGLKAIVDALRSGDNVLFYPAGKVYRSARESLGGVSGAAMILRELPDLRVVLVRTSGLWGSGFSRAATGRAANFFQVLGKSLLTLAGNLLFFAPRREVRVEFVEAPQDMPRNGDKRTLNPWLEHFYNEVESPALAVPRFFWQGGGPRLLPAPHPGGAEWNGEDISAELRESVYASLREAAGLPIDHQLNGSMTLSGDLGLDSLAMMELALAMESAHGLPMPGLENINTVEDCVLAASGRLAVAEEAAPAPEAWFAPSASKELIIPEEAATITEAFLLQARKNPGRALLADRSGTRGARALLTGALILARRFGKLPGERLGIMLPAAPAAVVAWLACLLAGKTPVFFNWTVGEANLRHCMALAGVGHIISAGQLLDRLEGQGLPLRAMPVEWLRLEQLAASLSLWEKICGAARAMLPLRRGRGSASEAAAVLFTSGSEALPKAVPLTHGNLLANARDIIKVLRLSPDESILAMLPPFHSFGLMAGLVLPLAAFVRAAYHPNPTEPGPLAGLVRDFKLTLMASPPTFLGAVLDRARGSEDLASLRYAFVGAEKCPEHVYKAFARQCPNADLCEGYGITECSPVVSVNRPGDALAGSIGRAVPSVELALVREEDGTITGRAGNNATGMLLVRGPSVFHGYLGAVPSPFVEFEGKTWYKTGDLVRMDETGRIFFQGRLKRFVKIGGEMISLPQIEGVLLKAFDGREDAPEEGPALAVEAAPEELGAEIALFTSMNLSLPEVNAALRNAGLSSLYAVKRIVKLDTVPLLGSGKTDYRALRSNLTILQRK